MTALVLQKCSASGKNQQDPRLGGKRSKGSVLCQPKEGGGPTNTTLSRLGSSNPCADAEVQEDTHTELAKTRLSRERVGDTDRAGTGGWEPGGPLTGHTSWYNFMV